MVPWFYAGNNSGNGIRLYPYFTSSFASVVYFFITGNMAGATAATGL
jgi:hypothetical protein